VCITGGEPLLQKDIEQLITNLQKEKYTICLETNGSKSIRHLTNRDHLIISMDMKMPSSKMHIHNQTSNILHLTKNDQLKCIIQNKEDYEYAKKLLKKTKPKCSIIFQPAWGTKIKDVASWILTDNLSVRLGIQLHKMIWGANTNR
jgi:7-carboxy-7-deazaguanine synthase